MKMLVYVAALKEGDVILHQHDLHVVDVQTAKFDQVKVRAHLGDPNSMPGTYFYDREDQVYITRQYKFPDGTPMPESNTYPQIVGEEWQEGRWLRRLVLRTDGRSVWAVPDSVRLLPE